MTISTAPEHIRNRYLRGGCFAFAIELHRKTGLPLWGLMLGDELHHAFVADRERDLAIDIRGAMRIEEVRSGARYSDGLEAQEISEEQIMDTVFSFDPADLRAARRTIRDHLRDLPPKPRPPRQRPDVEDGFPVPEM